MGMPRLSILLPFYQAETTLGAAVESVCAQTFCDFELLLLDDGSTDTSVAIARELERKDDRIRLLTLPHQGIAKTLQTGCREARSAYIGRMDADDLCLPNRFAAQVAHLDAHPETGVVSCRVRYGGQSDHQAGYAAYVEWTNGLLTAQDHTLNRFVESPVAHPSVVWRREVMDRGGGYGAGSYPEDYELWLRWMQAGVRIEKIPEEGLVWRDPPSRLSRTDSRYDPDRFSQLKCRYLLPAIPFGRSLWLWGSGRVTRNRFRWLESLGRRFEGYVDISPRKTGQPIEGRPVVAPGEWPQEAFLILGVGSRGAREKMEAFLNEKGLLPGRDYWAAAL